MKLMNNYSILRQEEYRIISSLCLNGKTVDLGGSKKSNYHSLFKGEHKITTVNINKEYLCDLIFDIEKEFPIENNTYNNVICVNVLEHVFNFNNVISESNRILKENGKIILFVPFIFHIHGSPNDYFRYTKPCLKRILHDNSFTNIKIEELGFGLFSLFFQIIRGVVPTIFLKNIFKNTSIFLDKFLLKRSKKYFKFNKKIPLGYFVSATKR